MEIGPINDGRPAIRQPDGQQGKNETAERTGRPTDDAIISPEARERFAGEATGKAFDIDGDRPVVDNVDDSLEKLRLIRERIDSGYYDRAAVVDRTVERLIDEMLENIKLFYK